jgi:outer membrane protein OmpA-like peptidoglycan-associated protein
MIKDIEKIVLQGHTDSIGSHSYNDKLSTQRVDEVKKYMLSKNIPESLIQVKAHGKRVALNKNEGEQQRALNRRVEIEMVIKPKVLPQRKDTLKPVSKKPLNAHEAEIVISGKVLNERNEPLAAEIILSDKNGTELKTIRSDKDGTYSFKAVVNKRDAYTLTYYNDSSFVDARSIHYSNPRLPYTNLKTVLHLLKSGEKYVLENLNFEGDTSQLIPASLPSLEALYKVMHKNKRLVIRIEGHVNFPYHWGNPKDTKARSERYVPPGMNYEQFNQWLSEDRAKAVYKYLVKRGIEPGRMSTIGFGASKMLYPDTHSDVEMAKNRRVEINVISIK